MTVSTSALRLQVGARTLATLPRRLRRVSMTLEDALAGAAPALPSLAPGDHGYLLTSLSNTAAIEWPHLRHLRQRYVRHFVDLAAGEAAWRAALSGQARSGLRRKARRLAAADGGTLDVRRYRTPAELAVFQPLARQVSRLTYQEKLLGAGLPEDAAWLAAAAARAARDEVRAWLLFLAGRPIAYLWCGAEGGSLRYDFVGHDPAHAALSPGTVLMEAALADLFADRFRRFDFTEGEGQHKRTLASAGVPCRDLLLLRPTLGNRAAVATLAGFEAGLALARRAAAAPALAGVARAVRRAA